MNLDEISISGTFLTACALKPVQEYGRLATVIMEMKGLFPVCKILNFNILAYP